MAGRSATASSSFPANVHADSAAVVAWGQRSAAVVAWWQRSAALAERR